MTKCPNCSGESADTQRFCGECGTPLPAQGATRTIPGPREAAAPPLAGVPPGSLIAQRYQTIEELGAGGMGRVYRVLDTKVGEEIALKIIRPEISEGRGVADRFASELKLARQIVHRNVARMFDLNEAAGVPYITMEYVRGENLKRLIRKVGRLSPTQAVPIACQICDGLAEAHRLGILHRDLKPHNVMIDEEGQAKILDFGLAQLFSQPGQDKGSSLSGTPAYLSPEQIKGRPADARSDIYSLGVLMYEMLTGHTPFKAEGLEKLLDMQIKVVPESPRSVNPGISAELSDLIMKCLAKDPAERCQTAEELGRALGCLRSTPAKSAIVRWALAHKTLSVPAGAVLAALIGLSGYLLVKSMLPTGLPAAKSSVAVLKMPPTAEAALGLPTSLQESLSVKLASVQDLVVVPPLTINTAATAGKDPRRIGRLLKADYLLDPSCRVEGDRITLSAQLISTRRNEPVRGYEFTRGRSDPSTVEEEFARAIATVLRYDIAEDRLRKSGRGVTSKLDARLLVHNGLTIIDEVYLLKRPAADFALAVEDFKQALAIDPNDALALYALGSAYDIRYNNAPRGQRDPRDLDLMIEYYSRAHNKNPFSPETNLGLGWANFNRGKFIDAFDYFGKALKFAPEMGLVQQNVGAFLRSIGLYRQAIPHLEHSSEQSPQDPEPVLQLALCEMALGRFDEAAKQSAIGVARDPTLIRARKLYAVQLILAGRLDEGEKEIAAVARLKPDDTFTAFMKALLAASRGDKAEALRLKGDYEYLSMPGTYFYILLGLLEEAVTNIEAGIARNFEKSGDYLYSYPSLVDNPAFRSLRGLPRFQAIVESQKERYKKNLKPYLGML